MATQTTSPRLSRRTVFAGAGAAGAVAAAASLIPTTGSELPGDHQPARKPPSRGGGYSLSEHVKQYYKTART